MRRLIGLSLGFFLFFLVLFLPAPAGMSIEAKRTAAIALMMATFWITESIPIAATALIPVAAFPLLRVMNSNHVTKNYGDPIVFLFMGGFLIALAMQRWNLHRRIALNIIRVVGFARRRIILGFMFATAILSMFISNTATTVMMLPVALSLVQTINGESAGLNGERRDKNSDFGLALMLGIAYAASVGGIGTLIGTTPNLILAGSVKELFPELPEITFLKWMVVGLPLVIIFVPLIWLYLTFVFTSLKKGEGTESSIPIMEEINKMGKISANETKVLIVFACTVFLWMTRADIPLGFVTIRGWGSILGIGPYIHDSTVAIFAALILFLIPAGKKQHIMNWKWALKIPWGILILFGGGFALAEAFQVSGLSQWIGESLNYMKGFPPLLILIIIITIITFLTELTANTAISLTMMPVLAALAMAMGVHPFLRMIPAAMAASCAFMLPVATPPNAIVFGSGYITIPQMAKAGFVMDILGIILITIISYLIIIPYFHIL